MYLTLYISSNCKSPIIYDFEFFLRVRSQSQVFVVFAVKGCPQPWQPNSTRLQFSIFAVHLDPSISRDGFHQRVFSCCG